MILRIISNAKKKIERYISGDGLIRAFLSNPLTILNHIFTADSYIKDTCENNSYLVQTFTADSYINLTIDINSEI